jgi:hypothetical protein
MLIAGFPFSEIKPLIIAYHITLTEDPIRCNHDEVTWIKIVIVIEDGIYDKINMFMSVVKRIKDRMEGGKTLKMRKLFPNLYF